NVCGVGLPDTFPNFHMGGGVSPPSRAGRGAESVGWMARTGATASTAGIAVSDRGATVLSVAEVAIGLRDHSGWVRDRRI
ncbi:MAG TPA: hypothetical protein VFY56_12645, partial [Propionibacteriaceae bacterium]|nr:hypothetical protein [Propionibacteriaceae bacterium]